MDQLDYSLHYSKWHNDSDEHFNNYINYYKKNLLPFLPEDKEIAILDVGCGYGLALYALRKLGYKNLKGIDISPQQVKVGQSKGLNIEWVEDTNHWLIKNQNKFDVILTLDVLEHIDFSYQISFLKAIHQSLKAYGSLLCTVPNASASFAARWRYIDWTHRIGFTEHSLEFVLLNSGFKNVSVHEIEFNQKPKYPFLIRKKVLIWWLFKFFRTLRRLEAMTELGKEGKKIPLSLNIMAVAKK